MGFEYSFHLPGDLAHPYYFETCPLRGRKKERAAAPATDNS